MTALADLKTRIADEIDRTDFTSQIALAVTTAVSAYKFNRFAFNETTGTFSTTASDDTYTTSDVLPTDILELDTVRITVNSNYYLLEPVTWSTIDGLSSTSTLTGRPTLYSWYAEQLRVYPIPDAAYTITLRYLASVAEETWASRAENLIRARAKRELYMHYLFDQSSAAMMAQAEREALGDLKREARLKQATGRLVPHD